MQIIYSLINCFKYEKKILEKKYIKERKTNLFRKWTNFKVIRTKIFSGLLGPDNRPTLLSIAVLRPVQWQRCPNLPKFSLLNQRLYRCIPYRT
jgi:hypothetical protein